MENAEDRIEEDKSSFKIEVPEYIKNEMTDLRGSVSEELDFNDHEKTVFEILCSSAMELARNDENLIYYDDVCKKVWKYGQDNLIKDIYSDTNARIHTQEVIGKLYASGYCRIEKGTADYPVSFYLISPERKDTDESEDDEEQVKLIKDTMIELSEGILQLYPLLPCSSTRCGVLLCSNLNQST